MKYFHFLILLFWSTTSFSFDLQHREFDRVLKNVVVEIGHETKVDYDKLAGDRKALDNYLKELESVTEELFNSWSEEDQIAFLINAYNGFTLELILSKYPDIKSIRDLGGLIFSSPWDMKFFTLFGKEATLNNIENDMLRKNYNEPRIHFAINCASIGCPALAKDAYVGSKLEEQLEKGTKLFLTDTERNRFLKNSNRLEVSSIFNWFKNDFVKKAGSIDAFVAPYISDDPEIQAHLKKRGTASNFSASTKFLDYDWGLNNLKK